MLDFRRIVFAVFVSLSLTACSQQQDIVLVSAESIVTGAQNTEAYFPLLRGKKVAVVANQASLIGHKHLVDSLAKAGFTIVKVFSPEHGFRGQAAAGEKVSGQLDPRTGLPVISLYGKHKKPTAGDLSGVDIVLFDLQDVGLRFYTYSSTLTYLMEACAENGIPLIVLDRPNPNGFYVDGPVLEKGFESFVGLHPVPVVYGMTIGEYAKMVNGEGWLKNGVRAELTVIPMKGYRRNMIVKLPVRPSPNLPTWQSVYLYPSLCFFEGTVVSVGRGTDFPFEVYGHPDYKRGSFTFVPRSMPAAKHPKLEGDTCYGVKLTAFADNFSKNPPQINLDFLLDAYNNLNMGELFFNAYFDKLAGTDKLRKQILSGTSKKKIRASWKEQLEEFKEIRERYLIYLE